MSCEKKVAVVIVVWNNFPDTQECLLSLGKVKYQNFETVVVDNGSTDDCGSKIKELYPEVIFLRNTENLGYTGGCNIGIEYAYRVLDADYCLILNNDTVIEDEKFLETLVASAESQESIGIVAPVVMDYSSPQTIQSAGARVNLFTGRARLTKYLDEPPIWSDAVHGCAFLVKRKAIEDVGFLDDQFYLYWEETDYCLRVGKAGYRILIDSATRILHKSGKSIRGRGSLYTYYIFRNRLLLMRKHAKIYHWFTLIPLLPIYALIHIVKSASEGNSYWGAALAIRNAWRDFSLGNFGRRNK